jgi:Chaperone of endosialidase
MKTRIPPVLITLALICFAILQNTHAADGGLSNGNTAEGHGALESLTTGGQNTAIGADALLQNTIGNTNTASGFWALKNNTTGDANTASGQYALVNNTTGSINVADGKSALRDNTSGRENMAAGIRTRESNTTGDQNTAVGAFALRKITTSRFNTAIGSHAIEYLTVGDNNIALGYTSGFHLTTGSNNIDIGNLGIADESATIRIGSASQVRTFIAGISGSTIAGTTVEVNAEGRLGVSPSAARFKEQIKPMDKASEALFALKPVTFRYKKEVDPAARSQFGLVADEVEKVNPDLVVRDEKGKPYSVRYNQVNAMLLNEFLKEHRTVQEQGATITRQRKDFEVAITRQQKQIEALTAGLQKVSAQLEVSKPAPQTVKNSE